MSILYSGSGAGGTAAAALAVQINAARGALGGLTELPPLCVPATARGVAALASSAGCPYAATSTDPLAVLDALAAELQALRMGLAAKVKAAVAARKLTSAASLEIELTGLCRAMSVPPPRAELIAEHPDKVLAMVRLGR